MAKRKPTDVLNALLRLAVLVALSSITAFHFGAASSASLEVDRLREAFLASSIGPLSDVTGTAAHPSSGSASLGGSANLRYEVELLQLGLPPWITQYLSWHATIRARYPGRQLLDHPDAPPLLVRTCHAACGGLHDRLGQLHWDLLLANQTGRVFLIKWIQGRVPLESFLVPNLVDWSVPAEITELSDRANIKNRTELFEGNAWGGMRPTAEFWERDLDVALERAINGEFRKEKILLHRLLGGLNEKELKERLAKMGEPEPIPFGTLFNAFFRPSPCLQNEIDSTMAKLDLTPGMYSAVHCRVRHPKAAPRGLKLRSLHPPMSADDVGLAFHHGETRDFAVGVGTHALQCARTMLQSPQEAIYFMSDEHVLVTYVTKMARVGKPIPENWEKGDAEVDRAARNVAQAVRVEARDTTNMTLHIERNMGQGAHMYFPTFVDLYVAIGARCVTIGLGNYALFAAKISGTKCVLRSQEEHKSWGDHSYKENAFPMCTKDRYTNIGNRKQNRKQNRLA